MHSSTGRVALSFVSIPPDCTDCITPPPVRAEERHCNSDGSHTTAVTDSAAAALSPSFPASLPRRSLGAYRNMKTAPHIIMPRSSI